METKVNMKVWVLIYISTLVLSMAYYCYEMPKQLKVNIIPLVESMDRMQVDRMRLDLEDRIPDEIKKHVMHSCLIGDKT